MLAGLKKLDGASWTTPATAEQLRELEARVGRALPRCLREYLSEFGTLEVDTLEYFGLKSEIEADNIAGAIETYVDWCTVHDVLEFIPVAELGNGDIFGVSLSDEMIYLYAHELEEWMCLDVDMCQWLKNTFAKKPYLMLPRGWGR